MTARKEFLEGLKVMLESVDNENGQYEHMHPTTDLAWIESILVRLKESVNKHAQRYELVWDIVNKTGEILVYLDYKDGDLEKVVEEIESIIV